MVVEGGEEGSPVLLGGGGGCVHVGVLLSSGAHRPLLLRQPALNTFLIVRRAVLKEAHTPGVLDRCRVTRRAEGRGQPRFRQGSLRCAGPPPPILWQRWPVNQQ